MNTAIQANGGGALVLSFDDGPGPSTPQLLEVLRRQRCRALFFLLGRNLEARPQLAARMAAEGHLLGNHSYSHAQAGALTDAAFADEIRRTDALIAAAYRVAGRAVPARIPLRLPYGAAPDDPRPRQLAGLGRRHFGWSGLFEDWTEPPPQAEQLAARIAAHVDAEARAGRTAVPCLHDSSRLGAARPATVEAVRLLLRSGAYRCELPDL